MKIQFQNKDFTIFESALFRTTSSIIHLGDNILIVDPNWLPIEISFIQEFIRYHHADKKQYLLFTHSDYDHIIGWKAFPKAVTIASRAFVDNPSKAEIIQQVLDFDHSYYILRDYEIAYPKVDIVIEDSTRPIIHSGQKDLLFFNAPGHCRDALFLIVPHLKLWIAGDYLSNIEIPMIDDDFSAYSNTLKLAQNILSEFDIDYMITGHGDLASGRKEIERRICNDMKYLELLVLKTKENEVVNFIEKNYTSNPGMILIHENNMKKIKDVKE